VDSVTFRPLAAAVEALLGPGGRLAARRQLWPHQPDWHDAFVVLNANRQMPRKRVDLTIEAFARFARGKPPGVKLWLQHAIMSEKEHAEISALVERHGIMDRVRLSRLGAPPLSDQELNLAYNAADVGLNTAMGEGWGMVSFEHAAAGAAQIVPRHSACEELWNGSAEIVDTHDVGIPSCTLLKMRAVTVDGVAEALGTLYDEPERLSRMSLRAYQNATRPEYRWERIAEQWCAVLDDALEGLAASPGQACRP
jgi:glycosyltransferase involved in cell wall biosynthesis